MTDEPKPVLVTGANKGIGKATVASILDERDDTRVFLGSRSVERGENARSDILDDRPEAESRVEVVQLDVADDGSVEDAAATVSSRLDSDPLYGVVNNAGIGDRSNSVQKVLEVNVYGPHRICEAFLPMMEPPEGRIVNISSGSAPRFVADCNDEHQELLTDPEVTWEQIDEFMHKCIEASRGGGFEESGLGNGSAYGLSKACLNAYTMILARENPELTINSCSPGFIETDLTRPMAERRGKDPEEVGMKPPQEGTSAQMTLLFDEIEGHGWYYGSDAERSPLDRYRSPGDPPYTGD